MSEPTAPATPEKNDFIRQIVREDLASGKHAAIRTRFRPSPTATCTSATPRRSVWTSASPRSSAATATCALDDTNPAKEDPEYVRAIQDDVRWLGYDWHALRHASDYFEVLYLAAETHPRRATPTSTTSAPRTCAPTAAP